MCRRTPAAIGAKELMMLTGFIAGALLSLRRPTIQRQSNCSNRPLRLLRPKLPHVTCTIHYCIRAWTWRLSNSESNILTIVTHYCRNVADWKVFMQSRGCGSQPTIMQMKSPTAVLEQYPGSRAGCGCGLAQTF